jgi:hypothetical protein
MKNVLGLMLLAGCLQAQNSDLGLLLGISVVSGHVDLGTRVSGLVGAHGQINYAAQLREYSAGKLYLELPLLIGGHANGSVSNVVYGSAGGVISLTPGIRFNVAPHSRVSLYAAIGVGPAVFGDDKSLVGAGFVRTNTSWTVAAALDFGGGLDFRLTRLVSLRVEARDFVTGRGLGGVRGRNHPIYSFGLGLHW